jgi:hypothetical protein
MEIVDWSKVIEVRTDGPWVYVPKPATELQIERAKILWIQIKHHGVQVKQEEWIAYAAA